MSEGFSQYCSIYENKTNNLKTNEQKNKTKQKKTVGLAFCKERGVRLKCLYTKTL